MVEQLGVIIVPGVLKEEEGLGLNDHQSGAVPDQPRPRARTHNGSSWGGFRSWSVMLSAQLRRHQTTIATQDLLDSPHIFSTGCGCHSTLLVLAVIAALPSSSVHRDGRRRLSPLSSMMSSLSLTAVFRDVTFLRWPPSRLFLFSLLATASVSRGTFLRPSEAAPFFSFSSAGFLKWCCES